ncbi:MAG TPA: hypothetical protein VJ799_13935 [Nitrososphaeraceae archaeon]|nr:hypothetical protein [Nitrososphaeraceae archaeon]
MLSADITNRKRTATMTFRIDEHILNQLKKESERRDISLNILVNHVLKQYVEWDMYACKAGMVPVAKAVVSALFDKMTPQETIELASKVGHTAIHDIALFMKSKMDLQSFLSWFEMKMNNSSIEFSHRLVNNSHTYVIKHELGYNWSLYQMTLLELMFSQVFEKQIDTSIYDTTLTFQFRE